MDPEVRGLRLGGSEIGDVFDNPFGLWARKKQGWKTEPNLRMIIGKMLEPLALKKYAEVTGREVTLCDKTFQHPTLPHVAYTPDGLFPGGGVEAKVVFSDQKPKWGWEFDQIPARVILQVWWYMAAMDYDHYDVVALVLGEEQPRIYHGTRHRDVEQVMLLRAREYWERFLVGNDRPPFGDSPEAARWLQEVYPQHKRPDLRQATRDEVRLLEQYVALRAAQRKLAGERDQLEVSLKDAIKDREGLEWNQGRLTWRKDRDSEKIDWKSMSLGLINQFKLKEKPDELARLYSLYTRTKVGSRRMRLTTEDMCEDEASEEAAYA